MSSDSQGDFIPIEEVHAHRRDVLSMVENAFASLVEELGDNEAALDTDGNPTGGAAAESRGNVSPAWTRARS